MNINEEALKLHEEHRGKIATQCKVTAKTPEDLSLAYTPGVAEPCRRIEKNPEDVYRYTNKGNLVGVVTDGTAVLGLGDIGPEAALPVMEGKALLFKEFADVDAFPICLATKDVDEIVRTVELIAPGFGGINLEDIAAPRCFEIEEKLRERLDIPVFHDDQHGTAVVVSAAVINGAKILEKKLEDLRIVINGDGAAGSAIARMLLSLGVKDVKVLNIDGILNLDDERLDGARRKLAALTNPEGKKGNLTQALEGADVFVGVSVGNIVTPEMVRGMNDDPMVFAMANPTPEITPDKAREGGAKIIGTGRSDYPNQINNVLAFPGIFRGALDAKAGAITEDMKRAAAQALAGVLTDEELSTEQVLPDAFDPRVPQAVAQAVAEAWKNR